MPHFLLPVIDSRFSCYIIRRTCALSAVSHIADGPGLVGYFVWHIPPGIGLYCPVFNSTVNNWASVQRHTLVFKVSRRVHQFFTFTCVDFKVGRPFTSLYYFFVVPPCSLAIYIFLLFSVGFLCLFSGVSTWGLSLTIIGHWERAESKQTVTDESLVKQVSVFDSTNPKSVLSPLPFGSSIFGKPPELFSASQSFGFGGMKNFQV